jgi:hypothetical protein
MALSLCYTGYMLLMVVIKSCMWDIHSQATTWLGWVSLTWFHGCHEPSFDYLCSKFKVHARKNILGKFPFLSLSSICCRSRNLVRRLPFGKDTVGHMQNFAYLRLYLFLHVFRTARGCVDGVIGSYGLLRSQTEFRQHLLIVLRIHNLPSGTCIWRTAGRCCRNFV